MELSKIEKEVVFLKATQELIDEMVNYEVLILEEKEPYSAIGFKSTTHQKFFYILLVDFLSCSDKKVTGEQQPYLGAIQKICENPSFNMNESVNSLSLASKEFTEWLIQNVQVDDWSPEIETALLIKRIEFIKICGNISKHNFSRLSGVVNELKTILEENKICISFEKTLLILDDFYERFHSGILVYHGSTIAEFLNNIRWGIYDYLQLEFQQSIVFEGTEQPKAYHYTYPKGVNNDFAKNCYWNLMNEVRSKPYMKKFKVDRYLKMRYQPYDINL